MGQGGPPRRLRGGERTDQWDIVQSDQGDAGANRGVPDQHSDANLQPREHAPAVQEEPLRQPLEVPHQHHQEEALDVLRSTRGSQWDAATEGCVWWHIQHRWETETRPGEGRMQWAGRLQDQYDHDIEGITRWVEQALPSPEPQPEEPSPQDPQQVEPDQWDGWQRQPRQRHQERQETDHWDRHWGSRADWKQETEERGGRAGPGGTRDPWGAWKPTQQGQSQEQGGQPAELPPAPTRGDGGGQGGWQPQARRAPEWEADWLRGTSHPEMRYGDWRCGARPCHYANHAYRTVCKMCGASKDDAKWVLPHDPTATLCSCGVPILPHYKHACRSCGKALGRAPQGAQQAPPRNPSALPVPIYRIPPLGLDGPMGPLGT